VHLLDAGKVKPIARALKKEKNDNHDAHLTALLSVTDVLLPHLEVYLAPDDVADERTVSRGRQVLRRISTILRNVVRVMLYLHDVEMDVTDLCGKRAQEQWDSWLQQLPPKARIVVGIMLTLLGQVETSLDALDAAIRDEAKRNAAIKELETLPGIGSVLAYGIVAEIGDIDRFPNPKALVSCAGLAPVCHDSGEFRGKRRLPNRCNKRLRYLLVQAAQCASRCKQPNKARETYWRVKQRWDPTTSSIAAARELATEVFHALKRVKAAHASAGT
jgi:transposase